MRNKVIILCILLLLAITQVTVLDYLSIWKVKPDLLLAAIIFLAFSFEKKWVLVFSYFGGLFKDIFSSGLPGINTIIFMVIGYTVYRLSKKFIIETMFLRLALIAIVVILENVFVQIILFFFAKPAPILSSCVLNLLIALYTTFVSFLALKAMKNQL
jgi:rod shape-determining protein MreD